MLSLIRTNSTEIQFKHYCFSEPELNWICLSELVGKRINHRMGGFGMVTAFGASCIDILFASEVGIPQTWPQKQNMGLTIFRFLECHEILKNMLPPKITFIHFSFKK